jgi:hypothetical protein
MQGYVAQAARWRTGSLVEPVAPPAPRSFPRQSYVPLGYVWRSRPPSAVVLSPPERTCAVIDAALAATIVIVLGWEMHFIQTSQVRNMRVALSGFEALGQHLHDEPADGAVLTRLHSGSLRCYASATTVRWDQITAKELRQGIESELAAGRHPLLDR